MTTKGIYLNGKWYASAFLDAHPVNSLFFTLDSTNPGTLYGGTWVAVAQGRVIVGVDPNDTDFNAASKTGGSKYLQQHNHSYADATPISHRHGLNSGYAMIDIQNAQIFQKRKSGVTSYMVDRYANLSGAVPSGALTVATELGGTTNYVSNDSDVSRTTDNTGSGTSQNMPPYLACYIWKRTA